MSPGRRAVSAFFGNRGSRGKDGKRRLTLPPALREIFLPFIEAWGLRHQRRQKRLEGRAQRKAERLLHPKTPRERIQDLRGKLRFPTVPALQEVFLPWVE